MNNKYLVSALVVAVALAIGACGKKETPPAPAPVPAPAPAPAAPPPPVVVAPVAGVMVSSVSLGNAVDAAQNVTMPMSSFGTKDTIYAAVATTGTAASAAVAAKWTYQDGQVVNESSQTIAPTGPAVTTFHISKPDGWPVGSYSVEIMVDGKSAAAQKFDVK